MYSFYILDPYRKCYTKKGMVGLSFDQTERKFVCIKSKQIPRFNKKTFYMETKVLKKRGRGESILLLEPP